MINSIPLALAHYLKPTLEPNIETAISAFQLSTRKWYVFCIYVWDQTKHHISWAWMNIIYLSIPITFLP